MTRRDEIVAFIKEYRAGHDGYSPSIKEIRVRFRIGRTMVYRHLEKLEGEGRVIRKDGKWCLNEKCSN